MSTEIKVPELPESVADAVIASWYKQVGDVIEMDEVLVDLETDKVILEVPAVKRGVVKEILFSVGDTVNAGQLLAVIEESAAGSKDTVQVKKTDATGSEAAAAMSPSVRKLIAENSLDESQLTGTGKNGRILKQDVEKLLAENTAVEKNEKMVKQDIAPAAEVKQPVSGERLERRVPMTRLRARIAERMLQSQQQAAILTTFNEVNMKPVMALRSRYKDAFEKKYGVRLGFMSFFVQASVEALKRFPEINASIDGNDIVYHGYYDVGVAVSGPNGLVVPILRDADIQSIADIEQSIIAYAVKARENSLSIDDITGGTFTISNGGVFGSMLSTPIINPPQSAILGMHTITERAMVVDGEVQVLPMMYLALSYDHRLVDGKSAVQFLVTIKQLLEDPSRMLLGI
ncbi:MAG: 2-oxoglutarate dehydrogenase complex dihydrolipoyllysine-residue succinyltransferase [Gammaproteobacteria bacterium]|nr:2-oxoglutarate dehydrogenase complex dihydrolipoyllysine-residue succinyltransferase [Gammaproteobacteria bacterium]